MPSQQCSVSPQSTVYILQYATPLGHPCPNQYYIQKLSESKSCHHLIILLHWQTIMPIISHSQTLILLPTAISNLSWLLKAYPGKYLVSAHRYYVIEIIMELPKLSKGSCCCSARHRCLSHTSSMEITASDKWPFKRATMVL